MFQDLRQITTFQDALTRAPESVTGATLRKHPERDQGRRRRSFSDLNRSDRLEGVDKSTITVVALIDFFRDIIQTRQRYDRTQNGVQAANLFDENSSTSSPISNDNQVVSRSPAPRVQGAAAANAYQKASYVAGAQHHAAPRIDASNSQTMGLMNYDIQKLYHVIRDLQVLEKEGVDDLLILRSSDFVQSVSDAIAKMKM